MAVIRFDRGQLKKPRKTPQGYLKWDGWGARTGVQVYRLPDGTERRELRADDQVFDPASLAGFEGAPITEDHPSEMLTPSNTLANAKGSVLTPGTRDGNFVAITAVVTDAALIKKIESGEKQQLSVGYTVELDETPGEHPVHGKYDAIQKTIVVNHLAVLSRGRAGPDAAIRMDGALISIDVIDGSPDQPRAENGEWGEGGPGGTRPPGRAGQSTTKTTKAKRKAELKQAQFHARRGEHGKAKALFNKHGIDYHVAEKKDSLDGNWCGEAYLTTETDGHAHIVWMLVTDNGGTTGTGSASTEENYGHTHPWIRDTEGNVIIGATNGHTHEIEDLDDVEDIPGMAVTDAAAPDLHIAKSMPQCDSVMDELKAELKAALDKLAEAEKTAGTEKARADQAVADADKARTDAEAVKAKAEADVEIATKAAETVKTDAEKARKDAEDSVAGLVKARVAVMTTANAILGTETDRSDLSVRAIKCAVVKHVDGTDIADDKHDAYVEAKFENAVEKHAKVAASHAETRTQIEANRAAGTVETPRNDEAAANAALKKQLENAWRSNKTQETK